MRRNVLLITICCQVFWVAAQKKAPKWMDKQRKAVVTVTTYGKDNQKKASGTGFFITETGEALSGYSLFKDAARATVTDADGKSTSKELSDEQKAEKKAEERAAKPLRSRVGT